MKHKKFSFFHICIFGFNLLVGYAFLVGLSSSYMQSGQAFGAFGFPVLTIFCGLIAFIVGLSFGRLGSKYHSYGGTYVYVKHAYGMNLAAFTGWLQYIKKPLVAVSAISGIAWAFNNNMFGFDTTKNHMMYLTIMLPILVVYVFLVVLVNFGFNSMSIANKILWFFKWAILISILVLALTQISHFGSNWTQGVNWNRQADGSMVSPTGYERYKDMVMAIVTFFFAFGGMEGIAVISEDIENPKRNLVRAIALIIIAGAVFYFIFFYCMLGALGSNGVNGLLPGPLNPNATSQSTNPINSVVKIVLGGGAFAGIFTVFAIFSQTCNKLTVPTQNTWVNARIIVSLARDGILPWQLAVRNKHDQFGKAILMDSVIGVTLIIVYIIIGSIGPSGQPSPFVAKLDATLGIYTLTAFLQYIITLFALLKLSSKKHQEITIRFVEKIIYVVTIGVLMILTLSFFITGIISDIQHYISADKTSQDYKAYAPTWLANGALVFCIGTSFLIMFISKKFKWREKAATALAGNKYDLGDHISKEIHINELKSGKPIHTDNPDLLDEELVEIEKKEPFDEGKK